MGLKTELFIARKMLRGGFEKKISKPIVNLASVGIVLGVAVMILSISVASGFQKEVRDKVLGFGGHIQITEEFTNESQETTKMLIAQEWVQDIQDDPDLSHIQMIAYKPGIVQSKQTTDTTDSGKDIREISGVIFKGISDDYDYDFIEQAMVNGKIPNYQISKTPNDSILISLYTANQLKVDTGDKLACFLVTEEGPKQKNLIVGGVYETGLEDFDKQFVFMDLSMIQSINGWGIETYITIEETCTNGFVILKAETYGGNGNYYHSWNNAKYSEANRVPLCLEEGEMTVQLVSSDIVSSGYFEDPDLNSVPDTAWLHIVKVGDSSSCDCESPNASTQLDYVDDSTTYFYTNGHQYIATLTTTGGTNNYYCGGYEVLVENFEALDDSKKGVQFYTNNVMNVQSITDRHPEIFNWLNMLDLNVVIIISLMILVAIINMTSALLVIILERTRMIGIIKALGGRNWLIRKIFLLNGSFIILRGIVIGTLLAILIIFLQNTFGFLKLSQSNYYVSEVPMHYVWFPMLLINVGSFIICNLAMLLPSYLVTKIQPVKAIKFE
jgi:lipoprotein-releasing system permease protein